MSDPIRVAVVEDHLLVREGLVRHLEADPRFVVVAEERGATSLLRSRAIFDVCLLDLMTGSARADVLRLLRQFRVVVVTMRDDWQTKVGAWALGAHSVLYKGVHPMGMCDALMHTHRGQPFLEPNLANALIDAGRSGAIRFTDEQARLLEEILHGNSIPIVLDRVGMSADRFVANVIGMREECRRKGLDVLTVLDFEPHLDWAGQLTDQQLKILARYADGHTRKEIAGEFGLSEKTIENHITNALTRVGITSATTEQRLLFAQFVTGRLRHPHRIREALLRLRDRH
ncbi:response regulator transcription factor [Nonomuraea sp. LP-02]|uniref:response regulator transcription factor n=1 Tax=Nonomuraea sp. LP-02 TaxID=3097960 RepID=UPI002E31E8B1|nr:response regulator transcription factor [Nonomuraea sp. LP-02]MED7931844.1 response regulator transcription factor [Nonomuraea sp. LP-02]